MRFNLRQILKALLFSTSEPLSIRDVQSVIARYHDSEYNDDPLPEPLDENQAEMSDIIEQVPSMLTATQIRDAMDAIANHFIESRDVVRLIQTPSGYRITSAPEFSIWVRLLRNESRPVKLSNAAMETLAIVAYRQPVTRAEIEAIRGVSADAPLSRLQELDLVTVSGRAELPGRPLQFSTTDKFLEFAGIMSLEELPSSDVLSPAQLSEWIREAASGKTSLSGKDMGLAD